VTTLKDIGERDAIQYIFSILHHSSNIAVGPGDDCAALAYNDTYLLFTTDMINAQTHIPKKMTPEQLGWFITAINLSDIAAKGGTPQGILLSYGLPRNTTKEFLHQLTKGADQCTSEFDTSIIGGDLKEASEITITGTAIGIMPKNEFMPRKGIQPDDIVAVTGKLGKASAGYHSLQLPTPNKQAEQGLFKPYPRIHEGRLLAQTKKIHSSIDISDGLSSSLYQLQKINNIGFKIHEDKLPISSSLKEIAKDIPLDITNESLHFGGDYELLITLPKNHFIEIKKILSSKSIPLTQIGTATKDINILLETKKTTINLENKGYEHFLKKLY
jgi:thiamine-monophosphate kinase